MIDVLETKEILKFNSIGADGDVEQLIPTGIS